MSEGGYLKRSLEALETALGRTPAYASWRRLDPGPDVPLDERYAALPALTKENIRAAHPSGLIPHIGEPGGPDLEEALRNGTVAWASTSGTTDEQVTNLWNQAWWDASERASWRLNAVVAGTATGDHREALLATSRSIGPRANGGPLPFEARRLGRYLYLNEYETVAEWPENHCLRMAEELSRFEPDLIEASPSFLAAFARRCVEGRLPVPSPRTLLFTYELPLARQRRAIGEVFPCPSASSYGSTEAGYVLMECEEGRHHLNSAFCRADVALFRRGLADDGVGVLLATTFGNPWTQLLRFDIGDVVRLARRPCPCGRSEGLTVEAIEGRTKSLTVGVGGRLVTARDVDEALKDLPGIGDYSLCQEDDGSLFLRLVPSSSSGAVPADEARGALRTLYGAAGVTVEASARIAPEASGKYLYVRRRTPLDWRDWV